METPLSFAEILEAADKLSLDDQAELIEVLRHRVAERRQYVLAGEIQQAGREFEAGQRHPTSPADILKAVDLGGDLERLWRLSSEDSEQGLSTLAGGWEGSDEFVEHLAEEVENRAGWPRDLRS